MDTYIKLDTIKKTEKDNNEINLQEFKFSHDDETKIMKYINNFGDIKAMSKYIHFQNGKKDIFNLKISSNAPPSDEQKKNFFNFNTNPQMLGNNINNKNSSRLTNNSTENQEMENEINYNNSRVSNKIIISILIKLIQCLIIALVKGILKLILGIIISLDI